MNEQRIIAVFGSSDPRPGDAAYGVAAQLGRLIAEHGWTLLNGGYGGTMAASAEAAKKAGGRVIGVTLARWKRPNPWLDEEVPTATLYERLDALMARADAFLVLPGGTGTLAEIGIAWELMNKKFAPPRPLIFVGDFWQPLVRLLLPSPDGPAALGGLVRVAKEAEEAVEMVVNALHCTGRESSDTRPSSSTGVSPVRDPGDGDALAQTADRRAFPLVTDFRETRRNLPHMQEPGRTYFITFHLRREPMAGDERRLVLDACRYWDGGKYDLHAAVVMPDHVHLLLTPREILPQGACVSLEEILHSVKSYTSHALNRRSGRCGTVWVQESYDRAIRSEEEFLEKWCYIRENPVKAELSGAPEDYPFLYEDLSGEWA